MCQRLPCLLTTVPPLLACLLILAVGCEGPESDSDLPAYELSEQPVEFDESHLIRLDDGMNVHSPWAAVVNFATSDRAFCSGVMISSNAVLTAAHCLYDLDLEHPAYRDTDDMTVYPGRHGRDETPFGGFSNRGSAWHFPGRLRRLMVLGAADAGERDDGMSEPTGES